MSFRVLIVGSPSFRDYAGLRSILDIALSKRLSDVVLVTTGGSGLALCRVVCRFYDHPLVRELYPEEHWTWNRFTGRKQTNEAGPEMIRNSNTSLVELAASRFVFL